MAARAASCRRASASTVTASTRRRDVAARRGARPAVADRSPPGGRAVIDASRSRSIAPAQTHRESHGTSTDEFSPERVGSSEPTTDLKGRRMTARQPHPLARADRALPGRPDDRARHDDRERRAAVDPGRPRLLRDLAGLGRQRLPADVRRLPAARRPARRPLRPPPAVPRSASRSSRVASLACGLATSQEIADRRARGAGPRRRGRLGRRRSR